MAKVLKVKVKTGRPREYSDEEICAALVECHGLVTPAAKRLGCTPDTIYDRCRSSPKVGACKKSCRREFVDLAEQRLYEGVDAGKDGLVKFTLSTLGRKRGYGEIREIRRKNETTLKLIQENSLTITIEVLQKLPLPVQELLLTAIRETEAELVAASKAKQVPLLGAQTVAETDEVTDEEE